MFSVLAIALMAAIEVDSIEAPAPYAGNEELQGYLMEAGENHPALKRQHALWKAQLERIPQATALDDPTLMYGQFLESDMNRFQVRLAQKFPWFGTLQKRGDVAAREADAALAGLYIQRNRIFADVKETYANYAYLRERIQVTDSQTQLLKYMEELEESRFSLGVTGQHDLLRVQIAVDRLEDRNRELLAMRPVLSAELSESIGRDPDAELPWPQAVPVPLNAPSRDEVLQRIQSNNPELTALEELSLGRAGDIELARKRGYPNFTLGVDHTARRRDSDQYALSLSLSIPIWRGKVRAGVREARYRKESVEHARHDLARSLETMAHRHLFELEDAHRRDALYRESLIPKAEQTYESLQSAYTVGTSNVGLIDVLDSANTLLELELEQRRAIRDMHIAAAELEKLTGGP